MTTVEQIITGQLVDNVENIRIAALKVSADRLSNIKELRAAMRVMPSCADQIREVIEDLSEVDQAMREIEEKLGKILDVHRVEERRAADERKKLFEALDQVARKDDST